MDRREFIVTGGAAALGGTLTPATAMAASLLQARFRCDTHAPRATECARLSSTRAMTA